MIDLRNLRENPDTIRQALAARGGDVGSVDTLLAIDTHWRDCVRQVETLRAHHSQLSKQAATNLRLRDIARQQATQIARLEHDLRATEQQLQQISSCIPNIPHASVPLGRGEQDNIEIRCWGQLPQFSFTPRVHEAIGVDLGIFDAAQGAKLARARFPLLRGSGALLEWALIQFMLDLHVRQHRYIPILPPFIANRATMTASGNLPKFEEQLFRTDDDLFLIPTAEVILVNMYMNEILPEDRLPLRFVANTPCFRREVGASGRDTHGIIRVHQFHKVELVKLTTPETSYAELETLVRDATRVLELLRLPYRVMLLCTGELGFSSAKTYDIEVWMPGEGKYREISSCSNCEDFQARRGRVRYRTAGGGKTRFIHGLNGSGVAVGRTFAALLENYQQADGSVVVPDVLRPYLRMDRITPI